MHAEHYPGRAAAVPRAQDPVGRDESSSTVVIAVELQGHEEGIQARRGKRLPTHDSGAGDAPS
eukprot:scaffold10670_cov142-Isochrysis_galbana.AAC.3